MSKLAILINKLGYKAISLTGWQAGIITNKINQNAKIENINTTRIEQELKERKIVIIAGFQGINEKNDITTFGRGGSDTTAVAVAAALKAKHCYIFSDVDGVYTTDPNRVTTAKKIDTLSYKEMLDIAQEGAKVLHNRCVEVGQKYNIPIITKSTFNDKKGSKITDIEEKIESTQVRSIIKNDNIIFVKLQSKSQTNSTLNEILTTLSKQGITGSHFVSRSNENNLEIDFTIINTNLEKLLDLAKNEWKLYNIEQKAITRISLVGHGMMNDNNLLNELLKIVNQNSIEVIQLEVTETKIAMMFSQKVDDKILEEIHEKFI